MLKDTAQLLVLLVAGFCARIIQMYAPVPGRTFVTQQASNASQWQTIDRAEPMNSLELSVRLEMIRRWIEDNLEELLRKVLRNEALAKVMVRIP
jgi:hypothetical protein